MPLGVCGVVMTNVLWLENVVLHHVVVRHG